MRKIEIMIDENSKKLKNMLTKNEIKPINVNGQTYIYFEGINFILLDEANYKELFYVCGINRKREGINK